MILILDTETSGVDPKKHCILELAIAEFDEVEGKLISCRSRLIKGEVTTEAWAINGISQHLVDAHGEHPDMLNEFVNGHPRCVLAHQADFDQKWVGVNLRRLPWVCTRDDIEWPRKTAMGSGSLEKLAIAHGVGILPGHRAIHDVLTIVRVLEEVHSRGFSLDDLITRALRPKATFQAMVSYGNNQLARDAGFRWEGDTKRWLRTMAVEDGASLCFPFDVREVSR